MNTISPYNLSKIKQIALWFRLLLSSLFITTVIITLICACLGQANLMIIISGLLFGTAHGIYNAETIRKGIGFYQYNQTMNRLEQ